jgi:hypothetical protein
MNLNHLLVPMIQAERENRIARQQLARDAAAERSDRAIRSASINQVLRLLPLR